MISKFVKEQKRYSFNELVNLLSISAEATEIIIKKLKEYGILRVVNNSKKQRDLSDLNEEDILVSDSLVDLHECYYVFVFVGIIIVNGIILKCYPKYIQSDEKDESLILDLKQVLRVLEKYEKSLSGQINLSNIFIDEKNEQFNLLSIILYILKDYHENGPYINMRTVIEKNGNGEILWDKTINETSPVILKGKPYYFDLFTKKRIANDFDYFERLHKCIVSKCWREIDESDLPKLFDDILPATVSDERLEDFGTIDYISRRIEAELNIQFNTHLQNVLKLMLAYVKNSKNLSNIEGFSTYGTNAFNLVWETVCSLVLDNSLKKKLKELPLMLDKEYLSRAADNLIELIDKPAWLAPGWKKAQLSKNTLIPDIATIYKDKFLIFDAKYYNIKMVKGEDIAGQPGIESISKQYLYQIAYQKFADKHKLSIENYFVMPTENRGIIHAGNVSLKMMNSLAGPINVILINAKDVYNNYLSNKIFPLSKIISH